MKENENALKREIFKKLRNLSSGGKEDQIKVKWEDKSFLFGRIIEAINFGQTAEVRFEKKKER